MYALREFPAELNIKPCYTYRAANREGDVAEIIAHGDGRSFICIYRAVFDDRCRTGLAEYCRASIPSELAEAWGDGFDPDENGWLSEPNDGSEPWYIAVERQEDVKKLAKLRKRGAK